MLLVLLIIYNYSIFLINENNIENILLKLLPAKLVFYCIKSIKHTKELAV
jgi:hypothetical protein